MIVLPTAHCVSEEDVDSKRGGFLWREIKNLTADFLLTKQEISHKLIQRLSDEKVYKVILLFSNDVMLGL